VDPSRSLQPPVVHVFAGGDLDRAAALRSDPDRMRAMRSAPGARYLPFRSFDPLVAGDAAPRLAWLDRSEIPGRPVENSSPIFLGLGAADGEPRFAVQVASDTAEAALGPANASFRGTREVAPLLEAGEAAITALGRSLLSWNSTHGHCPRCGSRTEMAEAGHARRCVRESCGIMQFPRTDPVVIMLVHREGRCLLGRAVRARRYPPGLHSCLAGYVEPGESIEEAVRRETFEEAGLRIGSVRYHSSQPWPFPSTLMIGCFAEALPGEVRVDPTEIESARWFTTDELRRAVEKWNVEGELRLPPPLTIAHQLARAWLVEADTTARYWRDGDRGAESQHAEPGGA